MISVIIKSPILWFRYPISLIVICTFWVPLYSRDFDSGADASVLGTGVNLGNALDAPSEGAWGFTLEASYFEKVRQAGFDSVRIPVRWSAHADEAAPFRIDETFFKRVDWAVEQAIKNDLAVVLNVHHYMELFEKPALHEERFLGLWRQISERYQDYPPSVFFEPLNEPNTKLTSEKWNALIPKVIAVIRRTNPERKLIMGAANWSNVSYLPKLDLPEDDPNLVLSFHYYSPHGFTHQSTPWSEPKFRNLSGVKWLGTKDEKATVTKDLMIAVEVGEELNLPVYLGEFGAYEAADMDSRVRWTNHVAEEARRLGMTIAYWEFGASFGLYDTQSEKWREELVEAILPEQ